MVQSIRIQRETWDYPTWDEIGRQRRLYITTVCFGPMTAARHATRTMLVAVHERHNRTILS